MSERLKEHDWKSCVGDEPTEGSNPSLSVTSLSLNNAKRNIPTPHSLYRREVKVEAH